MLHKMVRLILIVVTSVLCLSRHLAGQELSPADLTIPPFDVVEALPAEAVVDHDVRAATERLEIPREGIDFIRGVALLLIPQEFEDDDGWGDETKIQSGLNMRFDDGQLKTSRRWKHVNHGNWQQASGHLVKPEETFQLRAARLAEPEQGTQQYDINVSARLRVTGRQQQWSYGVMLWSISAEAVADVKLHLVVDVKSEIVETEKGTRLRFSPKVCQAEAELADYSLRRISHLKGKPVQEFGDLFKNLIQKRVARENQKLAMRINTALEEKPDRLEIPFEIADWFQIPQENAANCQISTHHWTESRSGRTMLVRMSKTVHKTTHSSQTGVDGEPSSVELPGIARPPGESGLTDVDIRSITEERLAAIRSAIEKGVYDSDAILEKALGRMLERLEETEGEQ